MNTILTYIIAWLGMTLLTFINSRIRESSLLKKTHSEEVARQYATMAAIIDCGAYIWLVGVLYPIGSAAQALLIGLIWLLLTAAFEFGFGRYVLKYSRERLLADYKPREGRFPPLLIWILIAPCCFYLIRK